jgi:uncharacterized coiled-coil DUF342 family protein
VTEFKTTKERQVDGVVAALSELYQDRPVASVRIGRACGMGHLNEVIARTAEANRQAGALRDEINRHRNLAEANREHADRLVSDSRSDDLRKRADEHDGDVLRLQARLKAVEKEIAALQKQEAAIRDEMLVP